jgi:hypothetical protein
MSTKKGK